MENGVTFPPQRLLFRFSEAAEILGVGLSTVNQLVARGEIPVVRIGRAVRIPAEPLREWTKQRTRLATRPAHD